MVFSSICCLNGVVARLAIKLFCNLLALLAHVLADALRLDLGIALMAEGASLILDESQVSQFLMAHLTGEALWVPGG